MTSHRAAILFLLLPGLFWLTRPALGAQTPAPQKACAEPEQKQLDFWLGTWDLTWPGAKDGELGHGSNTITRIMDGCVVQENFSGEGATPLHGMSVSRFDPKSGGWKQTWVDNQGSYLDFTGEFKDGQMVLWRKFTLKDGKQVMQRMVFKNITPDAFDWSWEQSQDQGKTWSVQWPIHYKKRS